MTTLLLPHAGHISEFADGFNGTCTQTALEVCLACVEERIPTQAHMVALTRDMIAKGICAANGAATLWAVAHEARDLGRTVATIKSHCSPTGTKHCSTTPDCARS